MPAFEPAGPDGRALWYAAYELLKGVAINDVLTYEDLETALDRPRAGVQASMRRAAKELLNEDKRAVIAVPNVGYRVIEPGEHLDVAKTRQRRSTRQLQRGQDVITNVDMSGMTPELRKMFGAVGTAFSLQLDFMRRLDVGQRKLADRLDAMAPKVDRTVEDVEKLKARLAALEKKDEPAESVMSEAPEGSTETDSE